MLAFITGCLATLLSTIPLSASAENIALPTIELTLKPKVCVLSRREEACYDEIDIAWQSGAALNICLYQKTQKNPLACWQNAHSGSHTMTLNTGTSLAFLLREMDNNQLLASQTFEVIQDHRQYRRARRNAWAFF
ncbi:DUF3019 domain-containing protein [Marinagarivorans algicola]|uniref:DUF3019 domain-containing protein n=1 Tax=Marinagarivorans algicola TaxID=1513270 RepID=UPI0006B9B162|nr:DUF3019 domain-containing protein [Marinagarivorans algicola]